MSEYINLNDNVYFTANFYHPTSGFSYAASATPRWLVWESGATLILEGDMTARSTIVGSYWGTFAATAANGFTSSRFYDVQVSGTVDGISGFSKVKEFVLADVYNANITQVSGVNVSLSDFGGTGSGGDATLANQSTIINHLTDIKGVSWSATTDSLEQLQEQLNTTQTTITNDIVNGIIDANVVQVSGVNVSIADFGVGTAPTVTQIRQEMDANSLMFAAISGQALTATAVRTEIDANSLMLTAISGEVTGLSGYDIGTNLIAISGVIVSRTLPSGEYGISNLTASDIRTEMDANSVMLSAISGQALTAVDVRTEMDTNSLMFVAISGEVAGLDGAAMRGTDNAVLSVNLDAVSGVINTVSTSVTNVDNDIAAMSGSILQANIIQVSGVYVDINSFQTDIASLNADVYFAHIKFVSDLANNQDEFAVQWFKNDQPVLSGSLTNPKLSVYNTSNGSILVDSVDMSYASSNLGVVRYNTSMVLASGEPYLVETSGTIDAITRVWKTIVGIDLI